MEYFKLSWLFISSYFPLYIFIGIIKFDIFKSIRFKSLWDESVLLFIILVIFILISVVVVIWIKYKSCNHNYRLITSVERDSDSIISYIFTYIIPIMSAFNDKFITREFVWINILLFLLVWYLYLKLNVLYLNPLLVVIGYIPYRVNDGIVLTDISYNKLLEYKRLEVKLKGESIIPGIFLAKQKDNRLPKPE